MTLPAEAQPQRIGVGRWFLQGASCLGGLGEEGGRQVRMHVHVCAECLPWLWMSLFVPRTAWESETRVGLQDSPCPTSSPGVNHLRTIDSSKLPQNFSLSPDLQLSWCHFSAWSPANCVLCLGNRFTGTSKAKGPHCPPHISGGLIRA